MTDAELATVQAECDERNRATSAREAAEFKARTADRWFAYWHEPSEATRRGASEAALGRIPVTIQTWIGEVLARVTWQGRAYSTWGFGSRSTRVNFRARGIDGREWFGTYYKSSGDYVRMRVVKGAE